MAYATYQDLAEEFGATEVEQLCRRDADGAAGADAVASRALDYASREVDARLAARFAVPLTTPPAMIVAVVCDLARARLYQDAAPEVVVSRAAEARKFLADIAAGRATLLGDDGTPLGAASEEVATAAAAAYAVPRTLDTDSAFRDLYAPPIGTPYPLIG